MSLLWCIDFINNTMQMGFIRLKVLIFINTTVQWHMLTHLESIYLLRICIDSLPWFYMSVMHSRIKMFPLMKEYVSVHHPVIYNVWKLWHKPWYQKIPHEWGGSHLWHETKKILGDNGVKSVNESAPGVRTSTMLFDSKKCTAWSSKLNDMNFKIQAHFLWRNDSHEIVWLRTQGTLFLNLFNLKTEAHFFYSIHIVEFWNYTN